MQPPEAVAFLHFKVYKWPKIDAKIIWNAQTNCAHLFCNLSPRFLRMYRGTHASHTPVKSSMCIVLASACRSTAIYAAAFGLLNL